MRTAVTMLLACLAAGCMTSPPVAKSARPRTAAGVPVTLSLADARAIAGELLMVDSATMTLLTAEGIAVVPHAAVAEAHIDGFPRLRPEGGIYYLPKSAWERLRLESRYPYGIPDPALQAIMQAKQQARVDTVRVP